MTRSPGTSPSCDATARSLGSPSPRSTSRRSAGVERHRRGQRLQALCSGWPILCSQSSESQLAGRRHRIGRSSVMTDRRYRERHACGDDPTRPDFARPGGGPRVRERDEFLPADPPRLGTLVVYDRGRTSVADAEGRGLPDEVEVVAARTRPATACDVAPSPLGASPSPTPSPSSADLDVDIAGAAAWSQVFTIGLGLIARGRLYPSVTASGWDAWRAGPLDPADRRLLAELAAAFPPDAHALVSGRSSPLRVRSSASLIQAAWDAARRYAPTHRGRGGRDRRHHGARRRRRPASRHTRWCPPDGIRGHRASLRRASPPLAGRRRRRLGRRAGRRRGPSSGARPAGSDTSDNTRR